jgi:hypothetical protein
MVIAVAYPDVPTLALTLLPCCCNGIFNFRSQHISIKLPDTITYVQENPSQVICGGMTNSLTSTIPTSDSQVLEHENQTIGCLRPISIKLIVLHSGYGYEEVRIWVEHEM